jgi:Tol biopolymer transport system component
MSDAELERRLKAWYRAEVGDVEAAPLPLRRDVAAITRAPSRLARRVGRGRGLMLFAAAALVLVGGAAVGSGLLRLPAVVPPTPVPSLAAAPTPEPASSPSPIATARPGVVIAYIRIVEKAKGKCYGPPCLVARLWIVGADGSDAHELFPDGVGFQNDLAWSPDGNHLLYSDDARLYLTDASGSEPQPVDTGCVAPCTGDVAAGFSSDGTRLVFVRSSIPAIATMDLASGQVTVLSSTAPDGGASPKWSPDGTRIVFWRPGDKDTGGPIAPRKAAVFVVDADGRSLTQITPATLAGQSPGWSPDGSRIVFTSIEAGHQDVYTIRPDGTDLRRLTADGISSLATWTPDGRILFARGLGSPGKGGAAGFWTMDPDGTNAAQLIPGVMSGNDDPMWTQGPVWQPTGGPSIVPPPWTPSTATSIGPPPPTPSPTPVPALAPGFSWTGSMNTKGGGTATLLADGRVLVVHGCTTTAELYDPASGTFNPTGSLTVTRSGATATMLKDGRVLVAGGDNCGDADHQGTWASAELYDPATGTFSPTGSMTVPRLGQTATLLADGRVLMAGGITGPRPVASVSVVLASYRTAILADTSSNVLASAELYDPATGTFSRTGSMNDFRDSHTATLLGDGRVLVVGGGGEGYASRTSAELYDPTTGKFSRTGSLKSGRWLHSATLLQDGRVLIVGGRSPKDSVYRSAEIYDPGSGTFSSAGSMTKGRQEHTATLLPDGRVLITGGYWSDGSHWDVLSSVELYDPATGTFTSLGSMGEPRIEPTATLLNDGRVLIAGGSSIDSTGGVALSSAVLYQP